MSEISKDYLVLYKVSHMKNKEKFKAFKVNEEEETKRYYSYDESCIEPDELLKLLRLDDESDKYRDKEILEIFHITKDSHKEALLNIKGVKPLIDIFENIEKEVNKKDIIRRWKEINFEDLKYELKSSKIFDYTKIILKSDKSEKLGELVVKDLDADENEEIVSYPSAYDSFKEHFDHDSVMNLINQDKLRDLITEALEKYKNKMVNAENQNKKKQFRLIKDIESKSGWLVRSITSKGWYHNYDNNIALYLTLVVLMEFEKKIILEKAEISDSEFRISFKYTPLEQNNNIKIYLNLEVINSEFLGNALKFKIKHIIESERLTFAITNPDSNEGITISNNSSLEKINIKIKKLIEKLKEQEEFINNITLCFESFSDKYIKEGSRNKELFLGEGFCALLKSKLSEKFKKKKFIDEFERNIDFSDPAQVIKICSEVKNSLDTSNIGELEEVYYKTLIEYYENNKHRFDN
ncbi:hypothetical protein MWH28_05090 [Natroniella sulfidigena]|uniref:hypothetical protein n=1 Tax=Natroniella sulfidigena TaxID=723921 RepID=UPI00200B88B3|nr:hypothetical protein [Natroniella sulfidigena]MCK8816745.1 hypothetical protein [Natroniella sulfidigena]